MELDLSFQSQLTDFVDRFRRILNSDSYLPGDCRRLAERCESMLNHMREHTMHLSNVASLDEDFSPVLELCRQIADFLEKTLELSWTARRFTDKPELCNHAKSFTNRVDEINCQVLIKLNMLARSRTHYPSVLLSSSSPIVTDTALSSSRHGWKLEAKHIRGMVFFILIVLGAAVLHLYDTHPSDTPEYKPKSHYSDRAEMMKL